MGFSAIPLPGNRRADLFTRRNAEEGSSERGVLIGSKAAIRRANHKRGLFWPPARGWGRDEALNMYVFRTCTEYASISDYGLPTSNTYCRVAHGSVEV